MRLILNCWQITYSHQTVPVILTHSVPISLKEMGEIDPHPNPN
jgi:hypothetical protein